METEEKRTELKYPCIVDDKLTTVNECMNCDKCLNCDIYATMLDEVVDM